MVLKTYWSTVNIMEQFRHACVLLLLASACFAFPTEPVARQTEATTSGTTVNEITEKVQEPKNDTIMRPPTVTYILGQSIQNGTVQSPAELLSPDRYEFYTFDDDGQIVKKLMSVEEIQRILARNKEGAIADTHHSTDYYQVLTVTPDIETLPAVRINPNEPLFSIHDVIASVQNVLKAEIREKMTPPSPTLVIDGFQNTHVIPEEELVESSSETGKPAQLVEENTQNLNESVEDKTTPEIKTTTPQSLNITVSDLKIEPEYELISLPITESTTTSTEKVTTKVTVPEKEPTSTKKPIPVTKKPTVAISTKKGEVTQTKRPVVKITTTSQPSTSTTEAPAEEKLAPIISTEIPSKPTMIEVLKVTSSVSQQTGTASHIPVVTTQKTITSTLSTTTTQQEKKADIVATVESTTGPIEVERTTTQTDETTESATETSTFSEALSLLDAHPGFTSNNSFLNSPDVLFGIESLLFDGVSEQNNATKSNYTTAESALSEVQLPMNQDLAESVSSVLSQIANEISLNAISFDENLSTTNAPTTTLKSEVTEEYVGTTEEIASTVIPAQWLKNSEDITLEEEKSTESTTLAEDVTDTTTVITPTISFRPQNKPSPFVKATDESEKEALMADTTTTMQPIESRTEKDESLELTTENPTTIAAMIVEETTTVRGIEEKPESLPQSEKNSTSRLEVIETNGNSSSTIEIIQEAETGRIPRPTQQPDEITNRPGSQTSTTTTESPKISTIVNLLESASTASFVTSPETTASSPITSTTTTTPASITTTPESLTTILPSTDLPVSEEANTPEEISNDSNPENDAENISIDFVPMIIMSSSTISSSTPETTTPKISTTTVKESEKIKLPELEDLIESKVVPDEAPVSAVTLDTPHKVIIAALSDKKTSPVVVAIAKDPPQGLSELKQNIQKPFFGKPQKPVFIKPTKSKPQSVESKPVKPSRPSSEEDLRPYDTPLLSSPSALELDQAPEENLGLEATTVHLEPDVREFVDLCNELAFTLWSSITHNGISFVRSVVVSPFAVTSLLAMVFLGARGPTSGQMNDILKLDDVVTFNPHLVFRNVTESLVIARNPGIATASFVRELYSDRSKGKLLDFYKERAQQFYDGHVEEINFKAIGETLRRQTNHLVKRQTWGKIKDFLQGSTLMLRPPLAAFSANIFQADCSRASTKDRDGEMYFVVLPSNRLRRLVPVPAAVWRDDFLAGYEPNLDATVAAVGAPGSIVTTIFVMPGQQGMIAPGDSLARLEHHLLGGNFKRGHWGRLMRSLLRRPGLELQVPRLTHKSVVNVTTSLQKMGLRDLFNAEKADLTGLNGLANDLHLSDMVQVNMFSTCGDDGPHHAEFYPATPLQRRDKSADNIFAESIESLFAVSDFDDPSISALPLELRPRQARLPSGRLEARTPDPPRLRLDRPFLFFVRHNPTGLILHVGRFNPRLMH